MIEYHQPGHKTPLRCPNSIKLTLTTIHHMGQQSRGPMSLFTVTHKTADFGDKYVARYGHGVMEGGEFKHYSRPEIVTADTLEELRGVMPEGCVVFDRDECDPPVIVETWI